MRYFSIILVSNVLGPISVVELAERAGRDYTRRYGRQVAKLEKLGLIIRRHNNAIDRRIREAVISGQERR